jgi:acetylornithine deacetylase/succinyl-diaminopimelate desuccinylase-like protein
MIAASQKRNVIPARCEVVVDCRLLPGQLPADAEALIREVLGDGTYELAWIEAWGGTRSTMESPLWDAVAGFVEEIEPGAIATPVMVAGFTDSHWLREAFGTVAYGFFPMRTMDPELAARLVHSADERAHVDDLGLGARFLRDAAQTVLG